MGISKISAADMLGIITAMPREARTWTASRLSQRQTITLAENIVLHVSGIGKLAAQQAAEHLSQLGATHLMSWGVAGGLAPNVKAGQLIIPDKIIDINHHTYLINEDIHQEYCQRLMHKFSLSKGSLLQSDKIIRTVAEKKAIYTQYQADAVDMESAAIAEIARQKKLNFLAVRAIVDDASMSLPQWVVQMAEYPSRKTKLSLLRKPNCWLSLMRLAKNFSFAQHNLRFAANIIRTMDFATPVHKREEEYV